MGAILVDVGFAVTSYRWPTEAGIALVEDLAAANGRCRVAFNTEVML